MLMMVNSEMMVIKMIMLGCGGNDEIDRRYTFLFHFLQTIKSKRRCIA